MGPERISQSLNPIMQFTKSYLYFAIAACLLPEGLAVATQELNLEWDTLGMLFNRRINAGDTIQVQSPDEVEREPLGGHIVGTIPGSLTTMRSANYGTDRAGF